MKCGPYKLIGIHGILNLTWPNLIKYNKQKIITPWTISITLNNLIIILIPLTLTNTITVVILIVITKEISMKHFTAQYSKPKLVVVGQTVGPFPAKRWPKTVCAPLNCARHRWLLPVNSDIWGFSPQCLSKLFLKEFTVLLLTTNLGGAFLVEVILIGEKCWATDVLKCFTISFAPLFLVL